MPPPAPTDSDGFDRRRRLGGALVRAVAKVRFHLLPTGEIAGFRRDREGKPVICSNCLVSALTHEALGWLDPRSSDTGRLAMAVVPDVMRGWFLRTVSTVRREARRFLAWQQEADGTWRLFGRASGVEPDAATTAAAAAALLPQLPSHPDGRQGWRTTVQALERFRSPGGPYYADPVIAGPASSGIHRLPQRQQEADALVNAHVLRFLVTAGEEVGSLVEFLRSRIAREPPEQGFSAAAKTLALYSTVASVWKQGDLPDPEPIAALLVPRILGFERDGGGFGGPLATAFAASALLDLGYGGTEPTPVEETLVWEISRPLRKDCETYPGSDLASAALNSAVMAACLARVVGLPEPSAP